MPADTPPRVDLLDAIARNLKLPPGCDAWALKSVHPDGATSHGFVWPLTRKKVIAEGPMSESKSACPQYKGDGLCLATSWQGMGSGGIRALMLLIIAYNTANVHGTDKPMGKLRVSECVVVKVIDGQELVRTQGKGADLHGANLHGADLDGADFRGADLRGADLHGADLYGADLYGADLYGADLRGAKVYATTLPAGFDASAADCVIT